ncbi:unnamed protein product [Ceutorhynchus assimilis]|uniref:Uncharacterized protein n=1 Tax=Ceutorhynchus assimilis TaxID=467358 RepID=A0A9N9QSG1_9CUCU|nr:unnamed protein product [Ceutorhynchus assimilis]
MSNTLNDMKDHEKMDNGQKHYLLTDLSQNYYEDHLPSYAKIMEYDIKCQQQLAKIWKTFGTIEKEHKLRMDDMRRSVLNYSNNNGKENFNGVVMENYNFINI